MVSKETWLLVSEVFKLSTPGSRAIVRAVLISSDSITFPNPIRNSTGGSTG